MGQPSAALAGRGGTEVPCQPSGNLGCSETCTANHVPSEAQEETEGAELPRSSSENRISLSSDDTRHTLVVSLLLFLL